MVNEESPKLRLVGILIGWLSLIATVVLFGVSITFVLPFIQDMLPIFIALAFNLLLNASWIYGSYSYKPRFCLVPILFWTVPAGFCLCFIFIGVIRGIQYIKMEDMGADEFPFYEIIACSLVFVAFYVLAIVCYRSLKKSANRNTASDPRPNVKYEVTKGSTEKPQRLRIYPTLVLEV